MDAHEHRSLRGLSCPGSQASAGRRSGSKALSRPSQGCHRCHSPPRGQLAGDSLLRVSVTEKLEESVDFGGLMSEMRDFLCSRGSETEGYD